MKLVIVLMLTALPFYCYAGSGCATFEKVINDTIDPTVGKWDYTYDLREFIPGEGTRKALKQFKQCFLNQSNDTLNNFHVMMDTVYNSEWCAKY